MQDKVPIAIQRQLLKYQERIVKLEQRILNLQRKNAKNEAIIAQLESDIEISKRKILTPERRRELIQISMDRRMADESKSNEG